MKADLDSFQTLLWTETSNWTFSHAPKVGTNTFDYMVTLIDAS